MPILFLITGISIIIVIWAGGIKVINSEITLGEITAFVVLSWISYLANDCIWLGNKYNSAR